MGIFRKPKSSEQALENYRNSREAERRKTLRHHLRMESLEHRVVFAGVSPVALNDFYEAVVDEPLQVESSGVLANDVIVDSGAASINGTDGEDLAGDMDSTAIHALEFLGPKHGELELNPDGTFSYQPDPGFVGMDGFLYQVQDGSSQSQFAAVTINVTDPNIAPVGANDFYQLDEDQALTIQAEDGVLQNDTDENGDSLTVQLMDNTEHGTLEMQADGSFSYTPDPDFYGTDAFTYRISDGAKQSDLVVVELSIEPVADAPVALGESLTTMEDVALEISSADLLANDSDVDSTELQVLLEEEPQFGTLTVKDDGSFTYSPLENFHGTDSFTYRVSDGDLVSDVVAAEIIVAAVNDAPIASDDSLETDEGNALTFAPDALLQNDMDLDGDALTAEIADAPQHGTLETNEDGQWVYTPDAGFAGMDSFSYHAMDGSEASSAMVSIQVHEVVQLPIANNESYQATAGEALSVAPEDGILANDVEDLSNPAPLEAEIYRGPKHGDLEMQADGSFEYTPSAEFAGIDSIIYRTQEGDNASHLAVATLYVAAPEIAPEVVDETADLIEPVVEPSPNEEIAEQELQPQDEEADATPVQDELSETEDDPAVVDAIENQLEESSQQEKHDPWAAFFAELDEFWFEITCFFG